jgi:hypothetical protein
VLRLGELLHDLDDTLWERRHEGCSRIDVLGSASTSRFDVLRGSHIWHGSTIEIFLIDILRPGTSSDSRPLGRPLWRSRPPPRPVRGREILWRNLFGHGVPGRMLQRGTIGSWAITSRSWFRMPEAPSWLSKNIRPLS